MSLRPCMLKLRNNKNIGAHMMRDHVEGENIIRSLTSLKEIVVITVMIPINHS